MVGRAVVARRAFHAGDDVARNSEALQSRGVRETGGLQTTRWYPAFAPDPVYSGSKTLLRIAVFSTKDVRMPNGKDLLAQMERTLIIPNSLAFWGLGQMGIAVKGPDAILYIDPCLSNIVEDKFGGWWARAYPPPLLPAQVNNATHFLISH